MPMDKEHEDQLLQVINAFSELQEELQYNYKRFNASNPYVKRHVKSLFSEFNSLRVLATAERDYHYFDQAHNRFMAFNTCFRDPNASDSPKMVSPIIESLCEFHKTLGRNSVSHHIVGMHFEDNKITEVRCDDGCVYKFDEGLQHGVEVTTDLCRPDGYYSDPSSFTVEGIVLDWEVFVFDPDSSNSQVMLLGVGVDFIS